MHFIIVGFILFAAAGSVVAVIKTHRFINEMETFWKESFGVPLPEDGFVKRKWAWYLLAITLGWIFYGLLGNYEKDEDDRATHAR